MNTSNTEGKFDQIKGKVEQAVGETFHDQSLANEGAADQVKGHAKEAWGNVKDTAHNLTTDDAAEAKAEGHETGHDFRTSVANAAESVKESINRGLHNVEAEHAKR
jgi:uncharacterized protein YjbJ (UPF0337 family)